LCKKSQQFQMLGAAKIRQEGLFSKIFPAISLLSREFGVQTGSPGTVSSASHLPVLQQQDTPCTQVAAL
jgi:hypothetical protein